MPLYDAPAAGWSGVQGPTDVIGMLTRPVAPAVTWTLYAVLMASLVLFVAGVRARFAATVHFLLYAYFYHVQMYSLNASLDRMLLQVSLLLCFARSDEVISLRARWRRRRGLPLRERVPFWTGRLIGVQGMFVYLGTGLHKVFAPEWHGGEVLYFNFINYWGSDLAFWLARTVPDLRVYAFFVYLTIAFEVSAPVGLYWRKAQPFYFLMGLGFHTIIAFTLQIWQFLVVPGTYVLYVDPEKVKRGWEWAVRRLAKGGAEAQAARG
jgi:hypothetical protein